MYPEDYKYTKEHEWIKREGDRGRVGITDHAQKQLGDVVYVELPKVGARFGPMDVFGSIESVKAVSDLYCPVSCEVVEVNTVLESKPEIVNQDPHGSAWMLVVKLTDPAEIDGLLSAKDYAAFVEKESES